MKQAVNFRLDETTLTTIAVLAKDLQTSKTDIIEKAVMQFAASRLNRKNVLMQFAATLAADEADAILDAIQADKSSKDIDSAL
ncbi:hypothetical protein [Methylocucumis oryzae]|uniref:Uncharacterized protein n=1 Tax=Methylocucumis oryzae TaxID=1632867 RepID=A0A0F3IH22_9GAMM|nr:hypothetical protein [Methylocucumis oryzae]KJV06070.1 hypothetical protein VZ94_13665 [Methylocucumis oryzae]